MTPFPEPLCLSAWLIVQPASWLSKHFQLLEVCFIPVVTAGFLDASYLWPIAIRQILRLVGLLGGIYSLFFTVFSRPQCKVYCQFIAMTRVFYFAIHKLSLLECLTIELHLKMSLRCQSVSERMILLWQNLKGGICQ